MGYNFLIYGCDQDFLLPPDTRDWLPAGHLSWAVINAVGELDLSAFLAGLRTKSSSLFRGLPVMLP